MKKVFAVFRRDLLRIVRNPVAALVAIGICVVPCLYAWINVLANWDPYENTSDIRVAVVNEDRPVDLADMGAICTGDMMIEALADNDKIGWQFVDRQTALDGVYAGDYYAAIVIPEDFTERLTGILKGETDKAHLQYYVNEKVNPISPKVTDTGASTIENQIDSQFIAKVGEVVAEKLDDAISSIIADSQGTLSKEEVALDKVSASLTDVGSQLGELSTSILKAQAALSSAADRLAPLEGVGTRVSDKLSGVLDRLGTTRSNANDLVSELNAKLNGAAGTITSFSSKANYDISSITGDISRAQSQLNAAIRTLETDLTDTQALQEKLEATRETVITIDPTNENLKARRIEIEHDLDSNIDVMAQITEAQQAKLDELRALAEKLQTIADEAGNLSSSLNERIQNATNALQGVQSGSVNTMLMQINSAIDTFARIGNELEKAATTVDPIISQTVTLTRQFADSLKGTTGALDGTRSSLADLADDIETLGGEIAAVRASAAWSIAESYADTDAQGVHDFLTAPVETNQIALFPVENYASGVAPFFTSLALWVGGIALIAIFKLEVDEEDVGELRPWQAYFGRWLIFVCLGALQAIVCCTGDLIIGIQCAHPWAFYLSAIVASFAFVNIIYGLSVAFKHLGKALAFTMVILQVPGSSGMYPIEMMPPFFQAIGPWLPFTYSNNALREAVGGLYGTNLAFNLGMLLLFVVPSILISVTARRHLVNINALFDQRLRATDHLMVSEPLAIEGDHYRLASVVKAIHSPKEYREELDTRHAAFERAYPSLMRFGVLLLFLLPLTIFCLMLILGTQLPVIASLAIALVGIYSFLLLVEFYHDRIVHKRALTEMSEEELNEVLRKTLREEVRPMAPVDAIIERKKPGQNTSVLPAVREGAAHLRAGVRHARHGKHQKGGDE